MLYQFTCAQCGKLSSRARNTRHLPKYCGRDCMAAAFKAKPASERLIVSRTCVACGVNFTVAKHRMLYRECKYCSRTCFYRLFFRGEERTCEVCGTKFRISPSKLKNPGRWCSVVCAGKGRRTMNETLRGSAAYEDWRKAVYARDDFTCQRCGQRGGRLHAHHIKQWSLYPALRLDISNGLTLHETCHYDLHEEEGTYRRAGQIGGKWSKRESDQ